MKVGRGSLSRSDFSRGIYTRAVVTRRGIRLLASELISAFTEGGGYLFDGSTYAARKQSRQSHWLSYILDEGV